MSDRSSKSPQQDLTRLQRQRFVDVPSEAGFFVQAKRVSAERASVYRCSFCSDRLIQQRYEGWRRALILLPVRNFKCPHCFDVCLKPVQWIGRILPGKSMVDLKGVSRKVRHANRAASKSSDQLSRRILKALSACGKWVTRTEESLAAGVRKLLLKVSPSKKNGRSRSSRSRRREQSED